ncbi:class I SAM-dependent DNA methyltransferase [Intestinibacillus massiliensis]|uniref:class I SAM-dependent DNA methyltransferase n=1 Tax=Intestinibacillus massiliensis TaxID=1871029 RepID=UPI000B35ED59|nr:class I SAM-dependent methyltransferase [Intestinibacillus massiliensis]
MDSYRVLSAYYDRFTDDVGYSAWADFFEQIFQREGLQPHLVLDLACGTGSISVLMAARGYEIIGVDASEEMLMQAMSNTVDLSPRPMFLHQRMEALDLYGTVDACLCCLDSVNYVTDPDMLQKAFERVALFLEPGGVFIFDINTPFKFERINGQSFVREDGDVYCVWQCLVEDALCRYEFDIFENGGHNKWARYQETHEERIYTPDEILSYLTKAGFSDIKQYPELSFGPVTGKEDRLFFTARKR